MHPDLAPHLHTEECNKLIRALQDCHRNHNVAKFWGECNSINSLMLKCLKRERQARRDRNYLKAIEHQAEVRKRIREDTNDYTEFFK